MNWSKAMAVGYVAAIILGAVIGGSFAPAWAGYVTLTSLALLPLIIFLKPEAVRSMSRHHFAEKFKMAFGGISAWLWGIVIFSIAGSVLLTVTDTEKSGTHELVTPILQSIVAAFVFYVIDVNYSRNQQQKNAYILSHQFLKNIIWHAKRLIENLGEMHGVPPEIYKLKQNEQISWKPEFNHYFSSIEISVRSRYIAFDKTKNCNTLELLWRHYQAVEANIRKATRWNSDKINSKYLQLLMQIDSCYLMQDYIPQSCDPNSSLPQASPIGKLSIADHLSEYILLCQQLEGLLGQDAHNDD